MIEYAYWTWFGTIYLLILTYKDFKNNMMVDDRYNWFMMGLSVSLYSHFHRPIWYIFLLVGLVLFLRWIFKKFEAIGGADVNTIAWIFLGFGIIDLYKLIWFCFFFAGVTSLYYAIKFPLLKIKRPTPFYPVLLASYALNAWLFGMYL